MTRCDGRLLNEQLSDTILMRIGVSVVARRARPHDDATTAAHEAGHAVLAQLYGIPVAHVSVNRRDGDGVLVPRRKLVLPARRCLETKPEHDLRCRCEDVVVSLGGAAAELQLFGEVTRGVEHDVADAWRALRRIMNDGGRCLHVIEQQWQIAQRLVHEHWYAIENIAGHLLRRRRLSGEDVARVVLGTDASEIELFRQMKAVPPGTPSAYWPPFETRQGPLR